MDRLNGINLAWIPAFIFACVLVGAGIGWLLNRRRR